MNVYSSHEVEAIASAFMGILISRGIIDAPRTVPSTMKKIFADVLSGYDLKQKIKNEKEDDRNPDKKRPWT